MTYENLVFEGGGVKGIAYAGAIQALDDRDILPGIQRVAGTSSGAITAAILALGANTSQVLDITRRTDYRVFMDDSNGVIRDMIRLVTRYGWYRGDKFTEWFRGVMKGLGVSPDATFRDLQILNKTYRDSCRDLHVVGTNLDHGKPVVFSWRDTPDMMLCTAVRISMSIPFFFASVKADGDTWADGGLAWNYPIDVFDAEPYCQDGYNRETLGLSLKASGATAPGGEKIRNFIDYVRVTASFFMEQANRQHVKSRDEERTIFIDTGTVRTTDFNLSKAAREDLIASGYRCTVRYLNDLHKIGPE